MEVTQLYSDPRHNPSCTRVKQTNPTTHSAVYPLLTLPWHNTMYIQKQGQPTRSSPFAPACFLSPYHSETLVPLVLNQVCHIRLFSFALRVFSMKWSNRHSVFSFAPFRPPTLSLDFSTRCCFCVCVPPFSPKYRVIFPQPLPEETRIFVFCGASLSSNFSISITFDIGYERLLLITYMLKQYSRFDFLVLLSKY